MKAKQVAFVVKYFPTVSETFIVNQINALLDEGFQVTLFAYNTSGNIVIHNSLRKHNLLNKVQYFKKSPKSKIKRFFVFLKWTFQNFFKIQWFVLFRSLNVFKYGKDAYTLKLFFESQWFLLPYNFNLIHAHFGMNGDRIAYLKAKNIIPDSVKLITSFHGYDLVPNKLLIYKTQYRYLFDKADAFTVNTPYLEGLLQQVNSNKKPIHILPVGLDTSFFKRNTEKKKNNYFDLVFCGKLFPLKGPDYAVKIVNKLHHAGYTQVRLHLIGDGVMRKKLEQQIQDCQLQNHIFLHGNQTQASVKAYFEQADVFILPGCVEMESGRAETQGLVVQEAQAMELPVVVSDAGGMKYGLLPNESGFVVKTEDIDGFVMVIEKLILNSRLKLNMGLVARQFSKRYDNNILVKKLKKIYNDIT